MKRTIKIVTLNLRHNKDRWTERAGLIVEALLRETADVIAFQEVWFPINQAHLISDWMKALSSQADYQVLVRRKRWCWSKEGIGILTRLPVVEHNRLDLPGGRRVAQHVRVAVGSEYVDIVNTHLHNHPSHNESIRLKQVQRLMAWIARENWKSRRWVVLGDLNATPDSSTIDVLTSHFQSAYDALHGAEPPFTAPTPLTVSSLTGNQTKTIDYIFIDPAQFRVRDARLICTEPHPQDATLFPSDHFGLAAELLLTR